MPVQLEWHSSMPVLTVTYSGTLSANYYSAMNRRRLEMLDKREGDAVLVVDLQEFTGFPDAAVVQHSASALHDNRIRYILAVLPDDLYRRVARAVIHNNALPVLLFPTVTAALEVAEALLGS